MLSNKVSSLTPSFTIGISTKVNELKKQGHDITNLSIGEPDFLTPSGAKEAAIEAIHADKTKYDSAAGLKELRIAIANKLKEENNLNYTFENIVVSSGAKHSITNTLLAFINPGDEVIIPKPYWVSYPEMVKLSGAKPVFVDTKKENSFKLKKDELLNAITDQTKMIFITNPSNPTGAVYSKDELLEIANVCVEKNIIILADEIYERICYDQAFTSIASLSEDIKKITVTINGLSKSAAMTGWRIGYSVSEKNVAKAISSIQGHLVSHPSTISQWASLKALDCKDDMQEMVETYKTRRDFIKKSFEEIEEISIIKQEGAFYAFMDFSKLKDKIDYTDSFSIEICNQLLENYNLALVPGVAFGKDNFVRMSYAASLDNIKDGISKIKKFINEL